jgi:hypothetical protein
MKKIKRIPIDEFELQKHKELRQINNADIQTEE